MAKKGDKIDGNTSRSRKRDTVRFAQCAECKEREEEREGAKRKKRESVIESGAQRESKGKREMLGQTESGRETEGRTIAALHPCRRNFASIDSRFSMRFVP